MLSKTLTNAMTACAIALAPASLHAFSYDGWCLLVGLADGSEHYVYVDEKDVDNAEISTFDGKTMKIKVTDKAVDAPLRSYEFEYENVSLIKLAKHAEEQTGIAGIGADGGSALVSLGSGKFAVNGIAASDVMVYTVDGRQAPAGIADSDGGCSVDLTTLPTGIYVIKYGNSSIKISKK